MIKSIMAESPERSWPVIDSNTVEKHKKDINPHYEGKIFKIPNPIICKTDQITAILDFQADGKKIRIYPPFVINEKEEVAGAFKDVMIPEGLCQIEVKKFIPETTPKGFCIEHSLGIKNVSCCAGIRIDHEVGAPIIEALNILIEQVAQYTYQWWLRSNQSPFNGMGRFGFSIGKNFEIIKELKYHGADKVQSSWYGMRQTQNPTGIEIPLDNHLWLLAGVHIMEMRRADQGFLAFLDAIASYMAGDDNRCVLNLCLCVEILGNKHRILRKKKDADADKLLKETDLVDEATKKTLRKLFIDRGHVAHGRQAHILSIDSNYTIEVYLDAVRIFLNAYSNSLDRGGWPDAMNIQIGKSGKNKQ